MSRTLFHSRAILSAAALTAALLGTACSTDATAPSSGGNGSADLASPTPASASDGAPADTALLQPSAASEVKPSYALTVGGSGGGGGTAGSQWASCTSAGRTFSARIYWNSSGYEYRMAFKSPNARVRQVILRQNSSIEAGTWFSGESFSPFPRASTYSYRTVRSGWPWGWHWHWSGVNALYQTALTVYVDDGNWNPDCVIHFYEQSDHF